LQLHILSFNAALQNIRLLGRSLYCPVPHVGERLEALVHSLVSSEADIVFLQEVFHHALQQKLYSAVRRYYPHAAGLCGRGWRLRLGNELLILSRHPLRGGRLVRFRQAAREELRHTSKGFFHVAADLPGPGPVVLVNVHATAGGKHAHPESPAMNRIRTAQLKQLLIFTRQLGPHILAGDFNAGPHSDTRNYRRVIGAGYSDAFTAGAGSGHSWDPANPLVARGAEAHLPPQRIDHIFLDPALAGQVTVADSRIALREYCVPVAGGRLPLSDHYAVRTSLHYDA